MTSAAFHPVARVLARHERQSGNARFWSAASKQAGLSGNTAARDRWAHWAAGAAHRAAKLRRLVTKLAGRMQ